MENTLFLSALLYLITGRTFTEIDAQEKKEIKKARRKAVREYVNRKIQDAAERKEQLENNLHIFEGADIEAQKIAPCKPFRFKPCICNDHDFALNTDQFQNSRCSWT